MEEPDLTLCSWRSQPSRQTTALEAATQPRPTLSASAHAYHTSLFAKPLGLPLCVDCLPAPSPVATTHTRPGKTDVRCVQLFVYAGDAYVSANLLTVEDQRKNPQDRTILRVLVVGWTCGGVTATLTEYFPPPPPLVHSLGFRVYTSSERKSTPQFAVDLADSIVLLFAEMFLAVELSSDRFEELLLPTTEPPKVQIACAWQQCQHVLDVVVCYTVNALRFRACTG